MPELWKPVIGWEGVYSVSDAGRLRYEEDRPSNRHAAVRAGSIVAQAMGDDGYFIVGLSRRGQREGRVTRQVHRLVAEAFIGPPPFPKAQVNHKNTHRSDNASDNLEWMTCKENIQHGIKFGLRDFKGEAAGNSKLTNDRIIKIRERAARGELFTAIARRFGVTNVNISNIATGKTWTHVGGPRVAKRDGAERKRLGIPTRAPRVRNSRQKKMPKKRTHRR